MTSSIWGHFPKSAMWGLVLAVLLVPATSPRASGDDGTAGLSGTVTADGEALASTWVTLTPVDELGRPAGQPQRTVTDPSGRYAFPRLAVGYVKVGVKGPLLGEFVDIHWPDAFTFEDAGVIELASGEVTADLDLPVGGSARGQVVEARTGAPVEGARVTASIAEDPSAGTVGAVGPVDGPGRFALTGLPPVPLLLDVALPPGSPYLAPSADQDDSSRLLIIDGAARTSGVVIGLRRAAEIRGTVLDDAGTPVSGAEVKLLGCSPQCPPRTLSDSSGAYKLVAVAPGSGLVVVAVPGGDLLGTWYSNQGQAGRSTDLTVEEGTLVDPADLRLTRAAFVTVEVQGASSDEPLRAVVRLATTGTTYSQYFESAPTGGSGAGQPSSDFRLRVGPVPPGRYALTVTPGAADIGRLPTRWVAHSAVAPDPTLTLAPGAEAQAVVRLAGPGGATGSSSIPHTSNSPGGWPGLAAGFLAPTPWIDLSPSSGSLTDDTP